MTPPGSAPDKPAQHTSRAGRWLAARTLRGRLIAGLLGLLALACATVGAVTYTHLHSVLISQLDTELTTVTARYSDCVYGQQPPGDQPPPSQPPDHDGDQHQPSFCAQQ